MQCIELRDRPSFGKKIGVEMSRHDFLQHVCEQIIFVVARCEGSYSCAELLELLGRKAAQRRQCEVKCRNFGRPRLTWNLGQDRRVPVRLASDRAAAENSDLFLLHGWFVCEEKCETQPAAS